MQLNKFLAHSGLCSRRNAALLIKEGRVKVNGKTVIEPGYAVTEKDSVTANGKKVTIESKLYIIINKPKGYIATVSDDKGRQTVLDLLSDNIKKRVYPVGRLDRDTTGLLLLTNDGELTQRLAHPKYQVQKTYVALLDRELESEDMLKIKAGRRLSDGQVRVDSINFLPHKGRNHVSVSLHSGKYRVIRRLFESVGYTVISLDRIKFASITKSGLQQGTWRFLTIGELKKLKGDQ